MLQFLEDIKTTPIAVTLHGPKIPKRFKNHASNIKFIALSNKQIENNPGFNFTGKVPNGIPLNHYDYRSVPKKNYLFFLGRISNDKGVFEAIQVAKLTDKKLFIAGYVILPFHKKYFRKVMKEIKGSKNIKYVGFIKSQREKVKYLKEAFCFLAPIKWEEPFGLTIIEAMACGTPVIAFNRGSVPEIVKNGKTGFIVENIEQMAKAIEKIPGISRKKCREQVEKNFTVQKMTDGYEKIYKKIIRL